MDDMTFETAITRLEEIVAALEKGGKTLDEAVKLFEDGAKLSKYCSQALENAELKIKQLSESEAENG